MTADPRIEAAARVLHADGCPQAREGCDHWEGMFATQAQAAVTAADEADRAAHIIRVCSECLSPTFEGALHRVSVANGPEDGDIACIWEACGHHIRSGDRVCVYCLPEGVPF